MHILRSSKLFSAIPEHPCMLHVSVDSSCVCICGESTHMPLYVLKLSLCMCVQVCGCLHVCLCLCACVYLCVYMRYVSVHANSVCACARTRQVCACMCLWQLHKNVQAVC